MKISFIMRFSPRNLRNPELCSYKSNLKFIILRDFEGRSPDPASFNGNYLSTTGLAVHACCNFSQVFIHFFI